MNPIRTFARLNRAARRQLRRAVSGLALLAFMAPVGPALAQLPEPAKPAPTIEWQEPQEVGQEPPPKPDTPVRTMKVSKFIFEGNTLIPSDELQKIVAPFEGQNLSLSQMKDLAKEVQLLYQRQGYFLVRALVPAQAFEGNNVKIQVIEGKIGTVTVEGADDYDPEWIKERFMVGVADGNFRSEDFQRALILLNEQMDLQVKAVLKPGAAPGTADVTLKVKDDAPVHPYLDYNNYGTVATGENRVGIGLDAGNLLNDADMLSLRGVLGFPSSRNTFYQINYMSPVNLDGTSVGAGYANGAFTVSQGLGQILDVRGDADIFNVYVTHALDRDLDFSSNIGMVLSHKNINNTFFGGRTPFSRDIYTMARFTYQGDWRGSTGRTLMQVGYSQGLGGTPASDPLVSRVGASGGFAKFNLDVARIQTLGEGVFGILRGSGQVASQPLYVAEQYALGGPDTVRGFTQAEILGDNAYNLSAELRWSPILEQPNLFQVAFFIDHGAVKLKRPIPGDLPRGASLTGAGFGFRVGLSDYSSIRLDLGFPLHPSTNLNGSSPAVYAGVSTRF